MERSNLTSIRLENASGVVACLAEWGELSRAELAEHTWLSLMTVGKIVDRLAECALVTQRKSDSGSAGRRSSLVELSRTQALAIYDLSGAVKRLCLTDLAGRAIAEHELHELSEAGFLAFSGCAESGLELTASGAILPDSGGAELLRELTESLGSRPDVVTTETKAAALGLYHPGEPLVLHIRARDGSVSGAILRDGALERGALGNACDIARLTALTGGLSASVEAARLVLDPECIRVETDGDEARSALIAALEPTLGEARLEVTAIDSLAQIRGAARLMLNKILAEVFS